MNGLRKLSSNLAKRFRTPAVRKPDTFRKQREQAKQLAAARCIEVEKIEGGGMNVCPPKGLASADDPYGGDHYADDWGGGA